MKHIISLGAGVQSSTMALMAAKGEITPMPEAAIFADTGWESKATYYHLRWLETQLPFPLIRVRREGLDLGQYSIETTTKALKGRPTVPFYLTDPHGMMAKQCSKEFKTRPVQRYIRARMLGLQPGEHGPKEVAVCQWLGISTDEASRQKDCELKYVQNRYPLCEMRMSRTDCLAWLEENDLPIPPKSSCIFCPFKSDSHWIEIRDADDGDWEKAIAFDEAIRPGFNGMTGGAYVHRHRVALSQVVFKADIQPNLFLNECEGMCGV